MRVPLARLPERVQETLSNRKAAQLNLYRALSNSPEAVESWLTFLWAVRDDFVTPRPLRELVILRVAFREDSAYEWHHHVEMARASGLSDEKVAEVRGPPTAAVFDEGERIALELADAICARGVTDKLAQIAVSHFGDRGFVELSITTSVYVMVARVLDALGVPLEEEQGGD